MKKEEIRCEVSQGSILGPLLFLIFYCFFILFADDTNLFMSHKNLNALIVQMNRELKVEGDYTLLILSISKTHFILLDRKETKPIIELKMMNKL